MFKKVLIAALAVVVGLAVIKGTWIGSHFRLGCKRATAWMKTQVKPETEIARLRLEVDRLNREDEKCFDQVARQRLEVRAVAQKLEKDRAELARLGNRIGDLRASLKALPEGENQTVAYRGNNYSRAEAERQIDIDFDRFQPLKREVKSEEAYLASLRKALNQNEAKLSNLKRTRVEMLTQLKDLEIKVNELRQSQKADAALIDDSSYTRVQKDIDALKSRLALEEEKLKVRGIQAGGPIEQAELERDRKAKREKELNKEFPTTPAAPVVNK